MTTDVLSEGGRVRQDLNVVDNDEGHDVGSVESGRVLGSFFGEGVADLLNPVEAI